VVPFAAFICAEELHASGVLAVVVAAFVVGNGTLAAGYQTRLQERYVWNSVDVLLERSYSPISDCICGSCSRPARGHESPTQVAVASAMCC